MASSPTHTDQSHTEEHAADDGGSLTEGPLRPRPRFVFDVDEVTYEYHHPTITGAEIMDLAGISPSDGLIQILPDGTRETVAPADRIRLVPGIQFKRRPRFKRG